MAIMQSGNTINYQYKVAKGRNGGPSVRCEVVVREYVGGGETVVGTPSSSVRLIRVCDVAFP